MEPRTPHELFQSWSSSFSSNDSRGKGKWTSQLPWFLLLRRISLFCGGELLHSWLLWLLCQALPSMVCGEKASKWSGTQSENPKGQVRCRPVCEVPPANGSVSRTESFLHKCIPKAILAFFLASDHSDGHDSREPIRSHSILSSANTWVPSTMTATTNLC